MKLQPSLGADQEAQQIHKQTNKKINQKIDLNSKNFIFYLAEKAEKENKTADASKSTSTGTKVSNENGDDKSSSKVADKEDSKSGKKDDRLVDTLMHFIGGPIIDRIFRVFLCLLLNCF